MQITSHKQKEQHQHTNRQMAELEVFDILTELLSISFEKYDMEVIVESDTVLNDPYSVNHVPGIIDTEIDFEDITETQSLLKITLSGKVTGLLDYEETFMLFFSLHQDHEVKPPWQRKADFDMFSGENSLHLHYGRKAEQLFDPVFRVSWIHKDSDGNRRELGQGKGILTFTRDQHTQVH